MAAPKALVAYPLGRLSPPHLPPWQARPATAPKKAAGGLRALPAPSSRPRPPRPPDATQEAHRARPGTAARPSVALPLA